MIKLGIATKLTLIFSVIILIITSITSYVLYTGGRENLIQAHHSSLSNIDNLLGGKIINVVDDIHEDVLFLSDLPPIPGIIKAYTQNDMNLLNVWQKRLGIVFEALLKGHPEYLQIRYIGIRENGKEIVRVERRDNSIIHVPDKELQQKGDQNYFQETISLQQTQVYLSDINLNREHGQISKPHTPTLRAATPVYSSEKNVFGIIIINVDFTYIFKQLEDQIGKKISLYLANHHGDYLLHPDLTKNFGFDLGNRHLVQNEFSDIESLLNKNCLSVIIQKNMAYDQTPVLAFFQRYPLGSYTKSKFIILGLTTPYTSILTELRAIRNKSFIVAMLLYVVSLGITLIFLRLLLQPLIKITDAVRQFGKGHKSIKLNIRTNDEIGVLAFTIQDMSTKIETQISEIKKREKELKKHRNHLEELVKERTAELENEITERRQTAKDLKKAKEAAETASRFKSEFLANMSHELRTPMNAILGFTQLMERDQTITPAQRENLKIIGRSGEHLLGLINDVLDMSKIEAGQMTLNTKDSELYHTILITEEMMRHRAQIKGLHFISDYAPENLPMYVKIDEGKLRQVLINLIGNAIKFTDKGSITLRIKSDKSATKASCPVLYFEIEDTGTGIAPDELDTIFDPFVQTQSGREREEGTGLGLAISRKFVRLMGGDISVKSKKGLGSVFSFHITSEASGTDESNSLGDNNQRDDIRAEDTPSDILTSESLSELSSKLLIKLKQAAMELDGELILSVIEDIRKENHFLAGILEHMAKNYRYDIILELFQDKNI